MNEVMTWIVFGVNWLLDIACRIAYVTLLWMAVALLGVGLAVLTKYLRKNDYMD